LKSFRDFVTQVLDLPRNRSERRPVPEYVAYYPNETDPKFAHIKDISSTGVYLYTAERWLPGSHVQITFQKIGPPEPDSKRRVTLQARTARWGEDGVGLAFTLPPDIDFDLWQEVLQSAAEKTPVNNILPPLRMARTLELLCRLCPEASQELTRLVRAGLGNMRVANAVQISLLADAILVSEPHSDKMRANPQTVQRIIADGSWADEDWLQQLWAGLLATSCAIDKKDQPGLDLVDRFSQLAPVHVRLFKAACERAEKVDSVQGTVSAKPLIVDVEEIQQITDVQSLARIERDVFHLADLDLLEQSVRSRSLLPPDEINITPSRVGLKLFALCNGHRGKLQNYYRLSN
jgi:hypothetical protein